jgi:tripartite-type tricarboxylate transporter receptor subunit TctC
MRSGGSARVRPGGRAGLPLQAGADHRAVPGGRRLRLQRALAIASKRRSALAPEIPTMAELGYAIDFDTWYGLYAPAGTARDILQRLHAETVKALQAADYKERAAALGVELIGSTPEELAAHQRAEIARWTKIGKAANIKVD